MIDKLKVDYRKILPVLKNMSQKYKLPDVDSNKNNYKILKQQEILKLQKVFINKLSAMMKNTNTVVSTNVVNNDKV